MNWQPVLEGDRLLLRPLVPEDWDALFGVASDRRIWEIHPAHDRWQEPVFRAFFNAALAGGGAVVVIDKVSGAIVGSSRWQGHDPADGGSVEIGWTFLAPSHWGGSFNREMKRLMLAHAFQHVSRVVFRIGETNGRSRKAMERIGGRLTDAKDITHLGGRDVAHVVYEITAKSFAEGPLAL
jgi:RimJ/RimL family protein N-acetyltransferase